MNRTVRSALLITSAVSLGACKIIQVTPEGGYIVSDNGSYDCPADSRCEIDVVNGEPFSTTFTAVANPGYVFTGWKNEDRYLCGGMSGPCSLLNVPGSFTDQEIDLMIEPVFAVDNAAETDPQQYFNFEIAGPVIDAICTNCHIEGGPASVSRLLFNDGSSEAAASANYTVLLDFLQQDASHGDLVLAKVRGVGHGGGVQLSSSSSGFQSLSTFIQLVADCTDCVGSDYSDFFRDVQLASPKQTLRRAALLLAGRLPSQAELDAVETADDAALKQAVVALMEGQGFHNFLTRGANDRLLTDAFLSEASGVFLSATDAFEGFYPVLTNKVFEEGGEEVEPSEEFEDWYESFYVGTARAPLELVAYVVENDRPYTEILTADYLMQNRQMAEVYRSGLNFSGQGEFAYLPGQNRGQVLLDDSYEVFEVGENFRIDSHSGFINYPVAGLLNTPAFLSRYPTTETNRNRARARWTMLHFLGLDIEKSASRTTDPVALADTNNPTMNNPACTVCHQVMDPVAGTFQNYGTQSFYLQSEDGMDSLPELYKYPEDDSDSLYQYGDRWFRDMRTPGFDGNPAPDSGESLQWLAEQLTADERFAVATVRFWWPSLMQADAVDAPGSSDDNDYAEKLRAFEAQSAAITEFADQFRTNYQLKDMLADLVVSPWFRARSLTAAPTEERQRELRNVGTGSLLTPAELNNKIAAVTGFYWNQYDEPDVYRADGNRYYSELMEGYRIYYGGIDSFNITTRARALNSIMTNVAQRQANQMACHTVLTDFGKASGARLLFADIDRNTTPDSSGGESQIKATLRQLHLQLLGEDLALDSAELQHSFDLLANLWQQRRASYTEDWAMNEAVESECNFPDEDFWESERWDLFDDPEGMLGTWSNMLVFFLTDHKFLHE